MDNKINPLSNDLSKPSSKPSSKLPSNKRQPWHLDKSVAPRLSKEITILGAGIAGCTTAVALAKRGFNVRVIDRHPSAGSEGAGNNQAVVYPKLSPRDDLLPRINLSSMKFASDYYKPFWDRDVGQQCGVLVLPESEKTASDFKIIGERFADQPGFVQLQNNSELRGVSGLNLVAKQGLFFPQLGWLPPAEVCQQLLAQQGIPLLRADIHKIVYSDNHWQLLEANGDLFLTSESLVIANAFDCLQFEQTAFLPLTQLRGQITELQQSPASSTLKTVICGEGYITPQHKGVHSCGATYNKGVFTTELRPIDHQTNLEQMSRTDEGLGEAIGPQDIASLSGRANYRCTTKDYLPIVGPVPNVPQLLEDYAPLRRDARCEITSLGSYLPNLYVHCGMGSRGRSYAPLTSEVLAAEIAGETLPIEDELRLAMHPARFLIRDLKKKRI